MRRGMVIVAVVVLVVGLPGCGDEGNAGARQELTWFIARQPGGAVEKLAASCSQRSAGRYRIRVELLPSQADQQREQLVRRLGAKDDRST